MIMRYLICALALAALSFTITRPADAFTPLAGKTASTLYGPGKRAIARDNARKHAWAREQIAKAVADASPWVVKSDEDLWQMILSPSLKRSIGVSQDYGCPACGGAIYGGRGPTLYAYLGSVAGHPWKVQCPNCREMFPKNDFGAFHASGISKEDGLFHYDQADQSLLFNTDHPDPDDPLHKWCVDDGNGWADLSSGIKKVHLFIPTYVYRTAWRIPIGQLANAYALTGDLRYAHKAVILLDRLADVYPGINGRNQQLYDVVHEGYVDGIIGPNYWEGSNWSGMAIAYDQVYEAFDQVPDAMAFIRDRSKQYRVPSSKESVRDVRHHIEQRLFVDRFSKPYSYAMNGTISRMCEATVDLVLRGDEAISEFASVHMPRIVPPRFLNEDGSGNERSISYDQGAYSNYGQLLVDLYNMDRGLAKRCLDEYPRFRAVFDFWPDIWCCGRFLPNIGDSSNKPVFHAGIPASPGPYLALFDLTGERRYAQIAWLAAGRDAANFPHEIYSPDPEGLFKRVEKAAGQAGEWDAPSLVKRDYRLGILRSGQGRQQQALWLFYSPHAGTSSHSHFDALNFGLFSHGLSMIVDQGYPLFTGGWPSRWEWTSHTRSHAAVTVDGGQQNHCEGGELLAFAGGNGVRLISAEAACVYDSVSEYKRTLLWVETAPGDCFAVDVFRVKGGRQHIYSLPIWYGSVDFTGPELKPQEDFYNGYVEQVRAGAASKPWTLDAALLEDWGGAPVAHLRVHGASMDAELLLGMGETRLGETGDERLPYLFLKRDREGGDLNSTFVHVYEPYGSDPFLAGGAFERTVSDESVTTTVALRHGGHYRFVIEDAPGRATSVRVTMPESRGGETFTLSGTGGMKDAARE